MGTFGVIPPHSVTYMEAACSFNEPIELHPFAFRTHAHTHGQSLVNTGETLKSCFLLSKTSETFVYFSVYRLFRFSYLSGLLLRFYCSIVYWLACWTFSWEIWGSNSRQDRNCFGISAPFAPHISNTLRRSDDEEESFIFTKMWLWHVWILKSFLKFWVGCLPSASFLCHAGALRIATIGKII